MAYVIPTCTLDVAKYAECINAIFQAFLTANHDLARLNQQSPFDYL